MGGYTDRYVFSFTDHLKMADKASLFTLGGAPPYSVPICYGPLCPYSEPRLACLRIVVLWITDVVPMVITTEPSTEEPAHWDLLLKMAN